MKSDTNIRAGVDQRHLWCQSIPILTKKISTIFFIEFQELNIGQDFPGFSRKSLTYYRLFQVFLLLDYFNLAKYFLIVNYLIIFALTIIV